MPNIRPAEHTHCQPRRDTRVANLVDTALTIAATDGIGGALDYMERHGIEHELAIRVLAAPQFHRRHVFD